MLQRTYELSPSGGCLELLIREPTEHDRHPAACTFQIIAGGEITNGKAMPNILARVKRGDEQIAEVEVMSVQRQQQEAKEVFEGEMCGLSLKTEKKLLIEEGDKLEFFTRELVKRTLS